AMAAGAAVMIGRGKALRFEVIAARVGLEGARQRLADATATVAMLESTVTSRMATAEDSLRSLGQLIPESLEQAGQYLVSARQSDIAAQDALRREEQADMEVSRLNQERGAIQTRTTAAAA